jgi:ribosomal-protein-alanine N-acetyltransferase
MTKKRDKNMQRPFLIGNNIYLRSVEMGDASLIQKWHNDPELRKLARCGELPVTVVSEEKDIKISFDSKDETYLMIVKKLKNQPIGFIRVNCLTNPSRNVWLRMIIGDKNSWGKHYASNALQLVLKWLFSELNIHRVTLETYATNKRAFKFFKKIGFKQEGIAREAHFSDGTFDDIICCGLLKREFKYSN